MKSNRTESQRAGRAVLIVLAGLALSGCIVQSIQPFYTASAKVSLPVAGEWNLVRSGDEDLTASLIKPWVFTSNDSTAFIVETFNKNNVAGQLKAVFFKVGDMIFCDFFAGELADDKCVNEYWVLNVRPIHTVSKVELKDDTLVLKPLNADWLGKALEKKEFSLPHIKAPDNDALPLFTTTSEEWGKFLKIHGANTNAFPDKIAYVLKKRKINDKEEAKEAPKDNPSSK